jgi:hypothetical protein
MKQRHQNQLNTAGIMAMLEVREHRDKKTAVRGSDEFHNRQRIETRKRNENGTRVNLQVNFFKTGRTTGFRLTQKADEILC